MFLCLRLTYRSLRVQRRSTGKAIRFLFSKKDETLTGFRFVFSFSILRVMYRNVDVYLSKEARLGQSVKQIAVFQVVYVKELCYFSGRYSSEHIYPHAGCSTSTSLLKSFFCRDTTSKVLICGVDIIVITIC